MTNIPFPVAFQDAKAHARKTFPEESCGLVVNGGYVPCENIAADPEKHEEGNINCSCRLCSFEIDPLVYAKYSAAGSIDMVIHSHPNGPFYPSKADMEGQLQTAVPWAIIAIDDERSSNNPTIWGGEMQPLVGRQFMHGVTDCYSVIKDAFAMGKDKLAEDGVTNSWPYDPIILPDVPREDGWWETGEDLYVDYLERAGFVQIKDAPRPGDGFLMKIRSDKHNHGGILISNDLIIHHLPNRLSRREPAGLWGRQASMWLRYVGPKDDA